MTRVESGGAMTGEMLVLFAHGSRDPRWRAPFERLLGSVNARTPGPKAALAFMEFCPPTLQEIADEAVSRGVTRIRLLPLFLAGGAHVAQDIPRIADEVRAAHPGLRIEVLPPVGEDPRFIALLEEIARSHTDDLAEPCPTSKPPTT